MDVSERYCVTTRKGRKQDEMNHTPSQTDHERMMEYHRIAIESKAIIEGIQKKLGVFTTTAALQKIDALLVVKDAAEKYLASSEDHLYQEGWWLVEALKSVDDIQ